MEGHKELSGLWLVPTEGAMPIQNWKPALNRFIIESGERLNGHL